jgi:hypothetical protein
MEYVCEYENDGVTITAPGKFEGEPVFAPYYWDQALEGCADVDDCETGEFQFAVDEKDLALHPALGEWLGDSKILTLFEDEAGFIHCGARKGLLL